MFSFRKFQRDDYTRAALAPSLILAHDTGLGKTLAAYTIPLLWVGWDVKSQVGGKEFQVSGVTSQATGYATGRPHGPETSNLKPETHLVPRRPVLFVVPGDLHENFATEGRTKFKTQVVRLPDQQAVLDRIRRDATGAPSLPPAFYITSYHELAVNGVRPFPSIGAGGPDALMAEWGWSAAQSDAWFAARGTRFRDDYQRLGATPDMALGTVQAAARKAEAAVRLRSTSANANWTDKELGAIAQSLARLENLHGPMPGMAGAQLTPGQQAYILRGWLNSWLVDCQEGIHEQKTYASGHAITCVFAPAMADLCGGLFAAAVVDEGVRMKGDDTLIGQGLRRLNPPHRLVLSGTPIKNRLPDLFWLAQWVGGMEGANARWPYEPTAEAKEEFIEEFMVRENNLTQARNAGADVVLKAIGGGFGKKGKKDRVVPGRFQKVTPECCNLHRLWKLVAPLLLRRRKDDLGEDIVKMVHHQVEIPLGTTHSAVYRYHLEAAYVTIDSRGREMANAATKLMALRQASACPHTANLKAQIGGRPGHHRSPQVWTPKLMACLTLLRDQMRRGRQGAVFSAFREPLTDLARFLSEAGVRCAVLNGDVSPAKRGALSQRFQAGRQRLVDLPIVLCGIESTAEGHNWPNAGYVVRYDMAQALDKNVQSVNRVHRLPSTEDVDVYDLVNKGTVDLRLRELCQKKGDTSDLVLDGRLMGEAREELNIQDLLKHAVATFDAGGTVSEATLVARWPALRRDLRAAQRAWDAVRTATDDRRPTVDAGCPMPTSPAILAPVHPALAWLRRLQEV